MAIINAPNQEINSQVQNVYSSTPEGQYLGQSATDKIAFYGKVPYAQKVPTVGLNSSYVGTLSTYTSASSAFGLQAGTVSGTATTWAGTVVQTATLSVASNITQVVAEVVNTLIGLGLWKGASA